MIAARMAGIDVFVTGGLGGVHRDGHVTMDISADITELGLWYSLLFYDIRYSFVCFPAVIYNRHRANWCCGGVCRGKINPGHRAHARTA